MGLSIQMARGLTCRSGAWDVRLLPGMDEVPPDFPATLLWKLRVASWEMQLLLWSTLGLLFGWLTERDQSQHTIVR